MRAKVELIAYADRFGGDLAGLQALLGGGRLEHGLGEAKRDLPGRRHHAADRPGRPGQRLQRPDRRPEHTKYPKQAWELEQWLGSPQSEAILGSGGYIWPAITSLDPHFL